MNMMAGFGLTPCPYCHRAMMPWEPGHRIHRCETCRRPLVLFRLLFQSRTWRIAPLAAVIHAGAALALILGVGTAILLDAPPAWLVFAVALPIAALGAIDIADGWLACRTGIGRLFLKIRRGRAARTIGMLRIVFGLAGCAVAVIGIMLFGEIHGAPLGSAPPPDVQTTRP
ncbi:MULTISPECIES: hypothetical protein [Sphingomonadaceae]|jgi:hypothetical protein|uniref:Uncharacterized protein n=1 Tax=Sphingobium yanoikuyae TaxID=13690 RepID=A0A3G2UL40_SPHYA|nr:MULTISPECIES: hypothetical protein [Sphingomonadaceae]PZU68184.1 MAG: hypothetical protein DI546_20840 [Rhizobium sp.]RSU72961.1 hypothetical protein BRX37_16905 [Sphingomonas sp. S-NIH.Pt3_0716]AYO75776.1 hypothetical protein EBF16_02055 [Sphingobium yanoikuyae]MBP8233377.1 hypothetical protein [Rhizorhabdus sp.]MDG2514778.1 hypothetical protein [Sphingobium yanoikuyae]